MRDLRRTSARPVCWSLSLCGQRQPGGACAAHRVGRGPYLPHVL